MAQRGKRLVDVEDALRWAYGGELMKRRDSAPYNLSRHDASLVGRWMRPPGYPEISPMFRGAFAGSGASSAGADPDRPRAPRGAGAPDPDALAIDEWVKLLPEAAFDGPPPVELAIDLGFALDCAGAYAAAAANVVNIVRVHGALGKRPAWWAGPPISRQPRHGERRPVMRIETVRYRTIETDATGAPIEKLREGEVAAARWRANEWQAGAYCKLAWEPDPQAIVNERAEYWVWRAGLAALAVLLSGMLEGMTALPPSAPAAPWLGERDAGKPPALDDGYSPMEALALAAQREARERRRVAPARREFARAARPGRSREGDGAA